MRGKTVKMLRKYATANEEPFRAVKRAWKNTPRDKRPKLRKQICPDPVKKHVLMTRPDDQRTNP